MRKPFILIIALSLVACKPAPLPGEPNSQHLVGAERFVQGEFVDVPLLQIGDRLLTLREFERRADLLSTAARYRLNSSSQRRRLLEMIVWAELIAKEAVREELVGGLDEQLLVADARAHSVLNLASRGLVNRADIADEDVRALFDATQDQIQKPEDRRVYTIVLPDRESAVALHGQIATFVQHDQAHRIFRALAPLYSVHEPTQADGLVGRIRTDTDGDPVFLEAAFSPEEPGLLEEVIQTSRGFEVIFIDRIRAAREIPFEEYAGRARERLHREALATQQRALLDEAREALDTSIVPEALAELEAARTNPAGEMARVRRFDLAWLSEDPRAVLGETVTQRLLAEMEAIRTNPSAAPGPFALDGSGETNDGSGDTGSPAEPNE